MCHQKIILYVIIVVIVNNVIYSQSSRPNRVDTTIVIELNDKWDLVSLPVSVMDKRVSSNFPAQYAWAFPNTAETPAYHKTDTMENGQGYWIKVDGFQSVEITGRIILEDTIDVRAGWNLIGSISRPVHKSRLRLIPPGTLSLIFCYCADCYCEELTPGHSYWIRSPHDGKLIISALSTDTTITTHLIDGWNLVSLPVRVDDTRVSSNFPAQYVFEYQSNPDNTSYFHRTDSLTNGKGYWMKVSGSQSVLIMGQMILEDTIDVNNGLNLIGSISKPVPVSNLRVIPQGEISIRGGPCGYWWGSCDTVKPGLAYWAKIVSDSSNLKLIMSAR